MDEIFIKKVCAGDRDAFRYFVTKYKDMAFTVAVSIVKDNFIAQEVVQDAFIKAFKNLQNYKGKAAFKTWFYRIVVNESLGRLKKEQKEPIFYTDEINDESITEHILLSLNDDEQTFIINESLNRLPPKESLVLRLFYLEEENIKNVCEITGWSTSNTKVILHRARKNMLLMMNQIIKKESLK
jgi:RNA polymerase sigma-70 factor (ECF subfamily)